MVTFKEIFQITPPKFKYQVDPKKMGRIIKSEIGALSFYSPSDMLSFKKLDSKSFTFEYSSIERQFKIGGGVYFAGTIYVQEPRINFEDVDALSIMKINQLVPDSKREIFGAIKDIVELAGIEEIVSSCLGVRIEDARLLNEIKGVRLDNRQRYGSEKKIIVKGVEYN